MDIDGVLKPSQSLSPDAQRIVIRSDWQGNFTMDVELIDWLKALACEKVWLTSWEHDASEAFEGIFDWPVLTPLSGDRDHGWWKYEALVSHIDRNPDISAVVWVDDDMDCYADQCPALSIPELRI